MFECPYKYFWRIEQWLSLVSIDERLCPKCVQPSSGEEMLSIVPGKITADNTYIELSARNMESLAKLFGQPDTFLEVEGRLGLFQVSNSIVTFEYKRHPLVAGDSRVLRSN
jgi:hypothetical protein